MESFTDVQQMEGKTVKYAKYITIECSDGIGIVFEDDTYVVIEGSRRYSETDAILSPKIDNLVKFDLGIITKEEYNTLTKDYAEYVKAEEKKHELKLLENLKKKYNH